MTTVLATLHMLLKPDKLPSLTTSYRSISLISSIMKLFERVIEQSLRSHLENIGFINKHQSGSRKAKSTHKVYINVSRSVNIMETYMYVYVSECMNIHVHFRKHIETHVSMSTETVKTDNVFPEHFQINCNTCFQYRKQMYLGKIPK